MSLSETDFAAIRTIVTDTMMAVLREDAKVNGKLAYCEQEAAAVLGIAKHVLRDCRLRGEIVGFRAGRKVCYARESLLKFITEQELRN